MSIASRLKALAGKVFGGSGGSGGGNANPIDLDAFLDFGEVITLQSSNVGFARYDIFSETLTIEYLSGDTWDYGPVSRNEAQDFMDAGSHGTWVWDHLRVRGEGNAHEHQKHAHQVADRSLSSL